MVDNLLICCILIRGSNSCLKTQQRKDPMRTELYRRSNETDISHLRRLHASILRDSGSMQDADTEAIMFLIDYIPRLLDEVQRARDDRQANAEKLPAAAKADKKVVDIGYSSQDGRVIWRLRYSDNSVGTWNDTTVETVHTELFQVLRAKLRREHGLE